MKHSPEGVSKEKVFAESMVENLHLTIEESNSIQMELIRIYLEKYPKEFDEDINKAANAWIQVYAFDFNTLIKNEPDLVAYFHEDPQRCLAIIAEKLYSHTIH